MPFFFLCWHQALWDMDGQFSDKFILSVLRHYKSLVQLHPSAIPTFSETFPRTLIAGFACGAFITSTSTLIIDLAPGSSVTACVCELIREVEQILIAIFRIILRDVLSLSAVLMSVILILNG